MLYQIMFRPPHDVPIPSLADVVSWPQAIVALFIIFALLMWPQVVGLYQNREIKRRQDSIEQKQQTLSHQTGTIVHEVQNNSGTSLRDIVERIEAVQEQHGAKIDSLGEKVESVEGQVQVVEGKVADHLTDTEEMVARLDAHLTVSDPVTGWALENLELAKESLDWVHSQRGFRRWRQTHRWRRDYGDTGR